MLEGVVDGVIGVDTHKHTLTAATVDPVGAVLDQRTNRAEPAGYQRLLTFGRRCVLGRRVWALEGAGSYGAGLAVFLADHGEQVVEIDRPARPARRSGAKSDPLDAARAAREALAREHLASPRARGTREALRVLLTCRHGAVTAPTATINQLKALVVSAPAQLRSQLASMDGDELVGVCARLRGHPTRPIEPTTVRAPRSTARRILALQAEVDEVGEQLGRLVAATMPALLEVVGIGPVVAAQLLASWSHPGRLRSEAAFAALAGAAPIPASSGKTVRYRLNRSGDRQLNRALHTIVLARRAHHPETRAYVARRTAQGKTSKEINRCLKRALARRLYKLLLTAIEASLLGGCRSVARRLGCPIGADQLDPLGEVEPPRPRPWRGVHHPKPGATGVLDRVGQVRVAWPERMWPDAGSEVPDQRPVAWPQDAADLG
jgi:transposase